jgi:hypothetical protein
MQVEQRERPRPHFSDITRRPLRHVLSTPGSELLRLPSSHRGVDHARGGSFFRKLRASEAGDAQVFNSRLVLVAATEKF